MKRILLVLLAVFVLGLVACSQPAQQAATPTATPAEVVDNADVAAPDPVLKELRITSYEFGFDIEPVTIKKGDRVRLTLTSRDGTHGIAMPELGVATGPVAPGGEEQVEFIANDAGSFDYYCNVPCGSGHRSMRGQIVVEE